MPSTLVLCAHPALQHSRVTRRLLQALHQRRLPEVQTRDLYALYPDYLVDADAEQAALREAQLVVWLHPLHWYGMPPLMKLWVDEVLAFGWAYGPRGEALRGKDLWLATSTGGPAEAYHPAGHNRFFFDAFMPPYDQTATLCGMRFLPPLVLHGAHRVADSTLDAHAEVFVDRLATYPDWPEMDEIAPCEMRPVAAIDRPDGD